MSEGEGFAERGIQIWTLGKERGILREMLDVGTVRAIALDRDGNLVAGASTGGVSLKIPGRVGDSSIVGAGFYPRNEWRKL